ncbi:hypothetical protein J421_4173 [Gemmatirosa kalamazoonensis]|uniref:Uncharacterized protein n=1 Tax=Gemmatirosa kalamazoonensis TaxID=861299 RepID=W0RN31_9BACT|nr:hypothetical protein [Gemmatirosa kalamazoonensis]AHG91710.1 hypothetical protein J421_4173 [Gemmatirosa kalamazoonensis]
MPYDPTPVGPGVDAHGRRQTLVVQIEGRGDDPERVLVLQPPSGGRVRVRETSGGGAPREYETSAAGLREELQRLHRERRRLNTELHLIERWLDGLA